MQTNPSDINELGECVNLSRANKTGVNLLE